MSIILKKKKVLLTPKPIPTNPSQVLGNLGLGSIIGILSKQETIMNNIIEEAIEKLITEKMLLISTRIIRSLEYFASYKMIDGKKEIKSLFLKKKIWSSFVRIDYEEMRQTGAMPKEFVAFLEKKKCKKIKISREQLENYI
jgi:hypothetical protein